MLNDFSVWRQTLFGQSFQHPSIFEAKDLSLTSHFQDVVFVQPNDFDRWTNLALQVVNIHLNQQWFSV